jgi:hypothetical protein
MKTQELPRNDDGTLAEFAWPGGYNIRYYTADASVLCAQCARTAEAEGLTNDPDDPQWHIVAADVYWEGPALYCEHCGRILPSEYGDPDDPDDDTEDYDRPALND